MLIRWLAQSSLSKKVPGFKVWLGPESSPHFSGYSDLHPDLKNNHASLCELAVHQGCSPPFPNVADNEVSKED